MSILPKGPKPSNWNPHFSPQRRRERRENVLMIQSGDGDWIINARLQKIFGAAPLRQGYSSRLFTTLRMPSFIIGTLKLRMRPNFNPESLKYVSN